jgi:rhodanese-related sulfurtransferase
MPPETDSPRTFVRVDVPRAREIVRDLDTLIVDVRDPRSFAAGHIGDAIQVSTANVGRVIAQTPRKTPVLVYCYHGISSQQYAQMFADFGFREVYSLDGGYEAWCVAERAAPAAMASM